MLKKQRGFTIIELFVCLWALFVIGLIGFGGYAVIHFILKFW